MAEQENDQVNEDGVEEILDNTEENRAWIGETEPQAVEPKS